MPQTDTSTLPAKLDRVTKTYGDVVALDEVSLAIRPGEILAVLGPNGAGKTTAVGLLLGLLRQQEGQIRLFGKKPGTRSVQRRLGMMLQISGIPQTLTVAEHVKLFSSYYPQPRQSEDVIRAAGLEGLEDRRHGSLSGGQQQRVLFALALCGNPELLFLDEPTAGLDVTARRGLWAEIRAFARRGRSVLLTTHYLEEADVLADRVVVLHRGKVVAEGTPTEIKARTLGHTVRCTTALGDGALEQIDGVERLVRHGSGVELLTRDADLLVRTLLSLDPKLCNLEVTGAALEDAFLALTAPEPEIHQEVT